MRLRPRRPRPQTNLTLSIVALLLALLIWAGGELVRACRRVGKHTPRIVWGRALVGSVSAFVFITTGLNWLELI